MIIGGKGGSNTTKSGLTFERTVDLKASLSKIDGYKIIEATSINGLDLATKTSKIYEVLYKEKLIAHIFQKYAFYTFLESHHVDYSTLISKKMLPDDCLHLIVRETLYIIEVKWQSVAGSVDEKLQTCDFKKKQYQKLVKDIGLKVEYVYVLNDWFQKPEYKDILDYVSSVNCHYRFGAIPLSWLGLPDS